ncbi:hypothetical protein [Herpetosiphon llansteffanensis]|uniref:hypothetical protein n=1 Tax=Herpetosiphon llansteffanensis TaxID=2094568 RepID=UPI000D7C11A0|nr:hypothetical protein [Herpetosiphon llansteffanensis]
MDQEQSDYTVRDLVQSLHGAVGRFCELIAPALEQYESVAPEIKITLPVDQGEEEAPTAAVSIHPFAEEVGDAIATLSQNFFDFFDTMQNVYARQRGDARRDSVPTRDDLVFRLFERWRLTGGPVGNAATQKQKIIAELEALFAPAPAEPDFSAAVCKAVFDAERWRQLTSDIEHVLITLVDDNDTMTYRRRAATRVITRFIEQFISNE